VFQFAQKELAPKANEIDRENTFKEMRVSRYNYISEFVPKFCMLVLLIRLI